MMNAMRYGVSRGLFSNEAGLGTTPHAHAIAKVDHPYQQGMTAIIGISVDLVVCTLTGLVLLVSGVIQPDTSLVGIQLMQAAFYNAFGTVGNWFVAVSLFFFALSTIVGWYFFCCTECALSFRRETDHSLSYLSDDTRGGSLHSRSAPHLGVG